MTACARTSPALTSHTPSPLSLLAIPDELKSTEYPRVSLWAAGVSATQAAAIAAEISRDRRAEECRPPEVNGPTIDSGNAKGHERSMTPSDKRGGEQRAPSRLPLLPRGNSGDSTS